MLIINTLTLCSNIINVAVTLNLCEAIGVSFRFTRTNARGEIGADISDSVRDSVHCVRK